MSTSRGLISLQITEDIAIKIRGMAEAGVFSIETGNAVLSFKDGKLKSIKTEMYSYPVDNFTLTKESDILSR